MKSNFLLAISAVTEYMRARIKNQILFKMKHTMHFSDLTLELSSWLYVNSRRKIRNTETLKWIRIKRIWFFLQISCMCMPTYMQKQPRIYFLIIIYRIPFPVNFHFTNFFNFLWTNKTKKMEYKKHWTLCALRIF